MPYVISFVRAVSIVDREQYINECCVGGDLVLEQLVPALRQRFGEVQPDQEDWGWFAWFKHCDVHLAVDVHTDDGDAGEFRIHLTSRVPRLLFGSKVEDTPQLDVLRDIVISALQSWRAERLACERADEDYNPV